jgi:hypothetical protein
MAPVRKSRSVNKRFTNETSPRKDAGKSKKNKLRKKKLSDKLGPQWTRLELERFYDAYRKHGQEWRRVNNCFTHICLCEFQWQSEFLKTVFCIGGCCNSE